MTFANTGWLWVGLCMPIVLTAAFVFAHARRRRALQRVGGLGQMRRMMVTLSGRWRLVRCVLVITGVSLCALALARPQIYAKKRWQKRGIDVAVVLDFSKSMLASDVAPSRVGRVQEAADELLKNLGSNRVATIVFSGVAAHFPLTHDHEAAASIYRGLEPADLPPGSDLGEGILSARCTLLAAIADDVECKRVGGRGMGGAPLATDTRPAPLVPTPARPADRGRAMVIFTDGEDTEGYAQREVAKAVQLGIDVYLVGVGTPAGELIPEPGGGWKKHRDGTFVVTKLEQERLAQLAQEAGGRSHYFVLAPGADGLESEQVYSVSRLIARLDRLKKGDLAGSARERGAIDVYHWLLFPAFVFLLVEACISGRRRRMPAVRSNDEQ